jgi:Rod binding domain-containing protein
MSTPAISPVATQAVVPKADSPAKVHDAAQQFEALLLGQILESVSQGGGWLGSGEDSASGCANSFAEQQLAAMMAKQGGVGLARLIETGLARGK